MCKDIDRSITFYTQVLDFEVLNPDEEFPYKLLKREGARLDISSHDGALLQLYILKLKILTSYLKNFFKEVWIFLQISREYMAAHLIKHGV
jgi:hypothetical protein